MRLNHPPLLKNFYCPSKICHIPFVTFNSLFFFVFRTNPAVYETYIKTIPLEK